jgi:hypothetical protein
MLKRAVALTLLLFLVAGCTSGTQERDSKAALVNATERTLSSESFHIESELDLPKRMDRGEGYYVAPDRFSMVGFGEQGVTSITIGRDTYSTDTADPKEFFHFREPCDFDLAWFFPQGDEVAGFRSDNTMSEAALKSWAGSGLRLLDPRR